MLFSASDVHDPNNRMDSKGPYKYRVVVTDPYAKELLPDYLGRKRAQIAGILTALNAGDYQWIENVAHRLYGSGMAYGLDAVSGFGNRLGQAAKARNALRIRSLVKDLDQYLENLIIV